MADYALRRVSANGAQQARAIPHTWDGSSSMICHFSNTCGFNMLCGNTDDNGRNHASFVGTELELAPAFDICPQARSGETAAQAMAFDSHGNRDARLALLVDASALYLLGRKEASDLVDTLVASIHDQWNDVCNPSEQLPQRGHRVGEAGTDLMGEVGVGGEPAFGERCQPQERIVRSWMAYWSCHHSSLNATQSCAGERRAAIRPSGLSLRAPLHFEAQLPAPNLANGSTIPPLSVTEARCVRPRRRSALAVRRSVLWS